MAQDSLRGNLKKKGCHQDTLPYRSFVTIESLTLIKNAVKLQINSGGKITFMEKFKRY